MKLHQLLKTKTRAKKRVGRGIGSGLGKTAGRGTKGQKARGKIPIGLPAGGLATFKKLPKRLGLGNPTVSVKPKLVNLSKLNVFKKKTTVDLDKLLDAKLVSPKGIKRGVKILGSGLTIPLIVKLPVSKKAKMEIERAGGQVENV